MTLLANTIQNGNDELSEEYEKGKNLSRSTLLYSIITIIVMLIFNSLAGVILTRVG